MPVKCTAEDEYLVGLWAGEPGEDMDGILFARKIRIDANLESENLTNIYPGFYETKFNLNVNSVN